MRLYNNTKFSNSTYENGNSTWYDRGKNIWDDNSNNTLTEYGSSNTTWSDQTTALPNRTLTLDRTPHIGEEEKTLIWILPAVLGILVFLCGIACLLFFVVRKTEILFLRWCYRRGCCKDAHAQGKRKRKTYNELKDEADEKVEYHRPTSYYLKDLQKKDPFSKDCYQ